MTRGDGGETAGGTPTGAPAAKNAATLAELLEVARRFRDERHWAPFHNFKDLALTLALEAAEVVEHAQWKNGPELEAHLRDRKEHVADELADVLHVVLLLADHLDVDLGEAFKHKMQQNARKYPVGKARGTSRKYTEL
jgi:NTP pyrophosphatase (non-canonical NTP hydrolase)